MEKFKEASIVQVSSVTNSRGNKPTDIQRQIWWTGRWSKRVTTNDYQIRNNICPEQSRRNYLIQLCRAMILFGAPTHRLEEFMTISAKVLEIPGHFLYLPSCMLISVEGDVRIVRESQGLDLGRMCDVHRVYKSVLADRISVDEAKERLEEIMGRDPKFATWQRVLMYGAASACVAPLAFGGRFVDTPIAFLLGCLLGVMQLVLAPRNELYAHIFEVLAAFTTSFIARFFGSLRGGDLFCFAALAQSSIALILPGFLVLCGSLELQSRNFVSGGARMMFALTYSLGLGFATGIGTSLYAIMDPRATSETECRNPLRQEWGFLFAPVLTLLLCMINQARWKQVPVTLVIAISGFAVRMYSFHSFGIGASMFGAMTIGVFANLYARTSRPIHMISRRLAEKWYPRSIRGNTTEVPTPEVAEAACPSERIGPTDILSTERERETGYVLAAAAMLPAILLQVPSALVASGSLLHGISTSDSVLRTMNGVEMNDLMDDGSDMAFAVLKSVIQVAISASIGLGLGALIVYPLGHKKGGLMSF